MSKMHSGVVVGIDGSNIRGGGGLKHLSEFLKHACIAKYNITRVILWTPKSCVGMFPREQWLTIIGVEEFEVSLLHRFAWRATRLKKEVRKSCHVLFSPGGIALNCGIPEVVMSQNMQPFIKDERKATGFTLARLRLELLRYIQGRSFQKASSAVFLTSFARDAICKQWPFDKNKARIIPHGIDKPFFRSPLAEDEYYFNGDKVRLLYVSTLSNYKHQVEVVDAVLKLHNEYPSVRLSLVGGGYEPYFSHVKHAVAAANDKAGIELVSYEGKLTFSELSNRYHAADIFIFASTCENLPNILLEAMASSLPIVCSSSAPMPSVLGESGIYCDATSSHSIYKALKKYMQSSSLCAKYAQGAHELAANYSWKTCSDETFSLLAKTAKFN